MDNTVNTFKVRVSGYKDYIAMDILNKSGKILATPIYMNNGHVLEIHTGRPSSERCDFPYDYDDFNDKWQIEMKDGELFLTWLNGPCHKPTAMKMNPHDLFDFKYGRIR